MVQEKENKEEKIEIDVQKEQIDVQKEQTSPDVNAHVSNFAVIPLRGYEMEYILRKSGSRNKEFADFCGFASRAWTLNHYRKPEVPLKVSVALRKFIGAEYFDDYLRVFRVEREKRIKETAGLREKKSKKSPKKSK